VADRKPIRVGIVGTGFGAPDVHAGDEVAAARLVWPERSFQAQGARWYLGGSDEANMTERSTLARSDSSERTPSGSPSSAGPRSGAR